MSEPPTAEARQAEFDGIVLESPLTERRPVGAIPEPPIASNDFVREVRDALGIPDDRAREAADWVLGKMDRFASCYAQPVFTIDGRGPVCSYCGGIWPLCGHQHYYIDKP